MNSLVKGMLRNTKYRPVAFEGLMKVNSGTNSVLREVAVTYLRK
jgi:hypothetical protein